MFYSLLITGHEMLFFSNSLIPPQKSSRLLQEENESPDKEILQKLDKILNSFVDLISGGPSYSLFSESISIFN